MLYYRAVTSGNGDGMIERYDGQTHQWVPGLGKFIARDIGVYEHNGRVSNYRCPYMDPLSFSSGRLHASWVWRDRFEKTNAANQHDLCYAYSDDLGKTWHNSVGALIGETGSKPIHLDTPGLVVFPIAAGSFVSNQNTLYISHDDSIHVMLKQRQGDSVERRYHHYWRDRRAQWNREILPFSGNRPKLVGTETGVLFLVYSEEMETEGEYRLMLAKGVPSPTGDGWQWEQSINRTQLTCGDPLVDVVRWENERVLSIYYQAVPSEIIQTNETGPVDGMPSPLHVIDYRLN